MQRTWWPEAGTIIVTGPYSMSCPRGRAENCGRAEFSEGEFFVGRLLLGRVVYKAEFSGYRSTGPLSDVRYMFRQTKEWRQAAKPAYGYRCFGSKRKSEASPGGGTRSGFIRGCAAPGSEPLPYFRESRTPKTYPILGKSHNPGYPKRSGLQKHTLI